MEHIATWSDEQLLTTAQYYGEEARNWRNKFLGLLPEIEKRRLYEKKGFSSIFHFAKVIGGVREEQVRDVIRFEKRLQETPTLHTLLVEGEVSMHKIEKILPVAQPKNDEFLADQVQLLSSRALATLAKDIKYGDGKNTDVRSPRETAQVSVALDPEVAHELLELRNKGIDIDEELRMFLKQRKEKLEEEKAIIATKNKEASSRYINRATRRLLAKEHGTKCAKSVCGKPAEQIHHTARFSLTYSHDPHFLAPLCKEHHQIAHTIDQKYQRKRKML